MNSRDPCKLGGWSGRGALTSKGRRSRSTRKIKIHGAIVIDHIALLFANVDINDDSRSRRVLALKAQDGDTGHILRPTRQQTRMGCQE